MEDIQVINFKMVNNIDWDELKKKVDEDLQKDIDAEAQTAGDINSVFGREGIINLKYPEYFSTHLQPIGVNIDPFNIFGKQIEEDEEETEDEEDDPDQEDIYYHEEDDEDYGDQGGLLPISNNDREEVSQEDIEKYAWNNKKDDSDKFKNKKEYINKDDIQCIHLSKDLDMYNEDSIYIYPLCAGQDLCLCKQCNMILASKIMEQLALEMFL